MAEFTHQAEILLVEIQVDALAVGQARNEKGPRIMPGLVVFGAGVTQADDQLYGSHDRSPFVEIARTLLRPGCFPAVRELLGSAFAFYVFSNARGVDVGYCQVVAVRQCNQLDALRQLEVGQVDDLTDFNGSHVDFDEFRQVFRQAGNFDFDQGVGHFATLGLHANRGFLVEEVQGGVGSQFLAGDDADEVGVHHIAFGRVTLQGFDQDAFVAAGDVQGQYVAERGFVFQQFGQFFGQQADRLRGFFATVDDGGNHGNVTTQAAARTFPQVGTHFGIQGKFNSHFTSPK